MKVYIVIEHSGEYEDYYSSIKSVFNSKKLAEAYIKKREDKDNKFQNKVMICNNCKYNEASVEERKAIKKPKCFKCYECKDFEIVNDDTCINSVGSYYDEHCFYTLEEYIIKEK